MPTGDYFSTSYLANYVGVSQVTIRDWWRDIKNGFPQPRVFVIGPSGRRTPAWEEEQLPLIRDWFIKRYGAEEWTDPQLEVLKKVDKNPLEFDDPVEQLKRRERVKFLMERVLSGSSWEEDELRRCFMEEMRENDFYRSIRTPKSEETL